MLLIVEPSDENCTAIGFGALGPAETSNLARRDPEPNEAILLQ